MPKKFDSALRERAVRLVREHRAEYPSNAKAIAAVTHCHPWIEPDAPSMRVWCPDRNTAAVFDSLAIGEAARSI
ncbi:hypothetical protein [Microbacterium sp. A84]|uniref:hypothetical protein n=1 Tax=Microbacterium sp. A84 TaxID=3450715 RepID=UPI003F4235D7